VNPTQPGRPNHNGRRVVNLSGMSAARKASFFCGAGAVLTLIVGAGFAAMRASGAPTSAETTAVRWIAVTFALAALAAYLVDRRRRRQDRAP
jgi:hypothetical protein